MTDSNHHVRVLDEHKTLSITYPATNYQEPTHMVPIKEYDYISTKILSFFILPRVVNVIEILSAFFYTKSSAMIISLLRFTFLAFILIGIHGCTSNFNGSTPDYVEVTSLDEEQGDVPERMTQAQLREEVESFAFRYSGFLHPFLQAIENEATTPEQRLKIHQWKKQISYSLTIIANDRNPEKSLLDMVVLVTLVRTESEEHLVPESFFGDKGQAWLNAVRRSEAEIWSIAKRVLDPQQQTAIRKLIQDWRAKNPRVKNLVAFRFSDFASEMGAEEAESLDQPGGLLPEVSEATQAVDEIRRTSERAMFLALASPRLARLEAESFLYDLATQPEFKEYRTSLRNFSEASKKLSAASDMLPEWISTERQEAIDQAMDRLFNERDKLFTEIDERSEQLKQLLSQIQETLAVGDSLSGHLSATMTTLDSLVTRLGIDKPDSEEKAFRIEHYRDTLVEAALTAGEINKVLQSLDRLLDADLEGQTGPSANTVLQVLDQHIERWILWEFAALAALVLLIAIIVVGALLFYQWSLRRLDSTR